MLDLQDPARTKSQGSALLDVGEAEAGDPQGPVVQGKSEKPGPGERSLLASLQGMGLKESAASADSGRSSPRQTETHTTPARSKKRARKHIPNRHTKSTSGNEKGFALPGALNSYPRFLMVACYADKSKTLLESFIFHKREPGIIDK